MRILAAVALVLLCGIGAAVLLCGWRTRRMRHIREQHQTEACRTIEDVARLRGM
ncbi:hypothetical protein [Inquilinus sp. CA228]|uniref:hypothetical protein n=1 Tax=Inquilinus sp. CA228 TaxID=3455609 RepID=UPI003F8CFC28